jgi:MarR family transcriptional regulator for hemolysin
LAPSLTGAQWAVIYLLHEKRVSTVSQLARALGADVAATWRLVGRLVDKGYVARRPDPADRRVVRLDLIPAALDAYPAWRATVAATLDRLLEGVATEDLLVFDRVLSGIIANGTDAFTPAPEVGTSEGHSIRTQRV